MITMKGPSQTLHRLLKCALLVLFLLSAISAQSAPEEKETPPPPVNSQPIKPSESKSPPDSSFPPTSSAVSLETQQNDNQAASTFPQSKSQNGTAAKSSASDSSDIDVKRLLDRSRWRDYLWAAFLNGYSPEESRTYPQVLKEKKYVDSDEAVLNDKRFMRGLRNDPSAAGTDNSADEFSQLSMNDKRFMRGFKRDSDFENSEDKRFMKGFKRASSEDMDADKRFMRGLRSNPFLATEDLSDKEYIRQIVNEHSGDKRFMRGLKRNNAVSSDGPVNDKRFMRGFRSLDVDTTDQDKRFIVGLNRFSEPADKRFIAGLNNYNKRFMYGLHNYDKRFIQGLEDYNKRFMRGFTKREPTEDHDDKRFIVGLTGYDRRGSDDMDAVSLEDSVEDVSKRFMRGLRSSSELDPEKRFMKGFALYSKKFNPEAEESSEDGEDRERRFMKGFKKSDVSNVEGFEQNLDDVDDKRFIKGLVRKSESSDNGDHDDKRFIKGLVRKSSDTESTGDKRFIKGLVKKDDDGLDDAVVDNDKRFMRGFSKKSDNETEADKRFMRGLVKKNQEEEELETMSNKRFMKGFNLYSKKTNNDEDIDENKRFMKGFHNYVKKDHELTDDELNNFEDKRFMRGFTKKDLSEKRFIKGLVKKDNSESEAEEEEKRFMRGFAKKDNEDGNLDGSKRFIKGLDQFAKKDNKDDKRFMKGFTKREAGTEPLRKRREIRFNDGDDAGILEKFVDEDKDSSDGMFEKEEADGTWRDSPVYTGLLSNDKRFMRGFENFAKRHFGDSDISGGDGVYDDSLDVSKRFIRGFLKYYDNGEDDYPKRFEYNWNKDISQDFTSPSYGKRFMRGFKRSDGFDNDLDLEKRFIKGLELYTRPAKRFIHGLENYEKRSTSDAFLDDKRFMKGFDTYYGNADKRFVRGLEKYFKRDSDSPDKRFMARYHPRVLESSEQALLTPSHGHSQDRLLHYSPYQPKRDLTRVAGSSSPSSSTGISSRRFMTWRDGDLVLG